jgi:hypothetical protein
LFWVLLSGLKHFSRPDFRCRYLVPKELLIGFLKGAKSRKYKQAAAKSELAISEPGTVAHPLLRIASLRKNNSAPLIAWSFVVRSVSLKDRARQVGTKAVIMASCANSLAASRALGPFVKLPRKKPVTPKTIANVKGS